MAGDAIVSIRRYLHPNSAYMEVQEQQQSLQHCWDLVCAVSNKLWWRCKFWGCLHNNLPDEARTNKINSFRFRQKLLLSCVVYCSQSRLPSGHNRAEIWYLKFVGAVWQNFAKNFPSLPSSSPAHCNSISPQRGLSLVNRICIESREQLPGFVVMFDVLVCRLGQFVGAVTWQNPVDPLIFNTTWQPRLSESLGKHKNSNQFNPRICFEGKTYKFHYYIQA